MPNIKVEKVQEVLNKSLEKKGVTKVFLCKETDANPQKMNYLFKRTPQNIIIFLNIMEALGLELKDFK